ncbi:hypothetical protein CHH83_11275 [Bacillus sp. 7586-K]|nr:hypothetical protein CHH83_11275 [Bacillus sp. 7586-K]
MGVISLLSIVIPTYNQRERLEETLGALAKQSCLRDTTVYVVNDGSTDGTRLFLEQLDYDWLKVIHQANRGRSAARNTGMQQARSKYVLFLDDDMVVLPRFIEHHLAAQQEQEGIYIGEILNISSDKVERFIAEKHAGADFATLANLQEEDLLVNLGRYFYEWSNKQAALSWVCMVAANVSFPISMFKQVNGFDERFKGWGVEDHELAFRFHQAGGKFRYLDEAKAFHLDHRKQINRPQLLENVLYFYKKSAFEREVKAYVDYVTGKISMSDLYRIVMKQEPTCTEQEIYFRPNAHLTKKESKEVVYATNS